MSSITFHVLCQTISKTQDNFVNWTSWKIWPKFSPGATFNTETVLGFGWKFHNSFVCRFTDVISPWYSIQLTGGLLLHCSHKWDVPLVFHSDECCPGHNVHRREKSSPLRSWHRPLSAIPRLPISQCLLCTHRFTSIYTQQLMTVFTRVRHKGGRNCIKMLISSVK